jgi:hypothetical protein
MTSGGAPKAIEVFVEGVGLWTPRLCDWELARAVLRGERPAADVPARRPDAVVLPPTERRRAPDSVAVALTVAMAACRQAQRDPASLPSVFASTFGDVVITDYMCATLASDPRALSPTRFHNSVHNAAAGYWTIATGCFAPYLAVCAGEATFAASLLAAAVQVCSDDTPVLLAACDVEARGPVAAVTRSTGMLGVALVLSPAPTAQSFVRLSLRLASAGAITAARPENAALVAGNAMAACLPLYEALADDVPRTISLGLGVGGLLAISVDP